MAEASRCLIMKNRVLVTGIGRSGTKYMSSVLTESGLACGHEALFDWRTKKLPSWRGKTAESSWYATPWLSHYGDTVLKIHLVRHPLDWLSSWVDTVWVKRSSGTFVALEHATGIDWHKRADRDPVNAAMELWVLWNGLIDKYADMRLQVEAITSCDIQKAMRHTRASFSEETITAALENVPTHVNSRPHAHYKWSHCEGKPHAQEFGDLAVLCGYPKLASHKPHQLGPCRTQAVHMACGPPTVT